MAKNFTDQILNQLKPVFFMCNHLRGPGWYFRMSAIFFSIFPALLLILAALTVILVFKSEIDNMSITCSDLVGRPRNLFNFLINPGIFLPWTLIEEKNPTETVT